MAPETRPRSQLGRWPAQTRRGGLAVVGAALPGTLQARESREMAREREWINDQRNERCLANRTREANTGYRGRAMDEDSARPPKISTAQLPELPHLRVSLVRYCVRQRPL